MEMKPYAANITEVSQGYPFFITAKLRRPPFPDLTRSNWNVWVLKKPIGDDFSFGDRLLWHSANAMPEVPDRRQAAGQPRSVAVAQERPAEDGRRTGKNSTTWTVPKN